MIDSSIKYFAIVACSIYTYNKLLNLNISTIKIILYFAFSLFLSYFLYFLRINLPAIIIPVMVVLFILFITILTKIQLELAIVTSILSLGISYVSFTISAILIAAISKLVDVDLLPNTTIFVFCTSLIQLILIWVPFRFRRFKKGMPFLKRTGTSNTGVLISVILLSCIIVITTGKSNELAYIIPTILTLICGTLILFWWRSRITKAYMEKIKADEVCRLHNCIEEKDRLIKDLEKHNEMLSKIIHRDNKLIPAMELMVSEYLLSCEHADINSIQEKGTELLAQLETVSRERAGIIKEYQLSAKNLPCTNVISIDSLISYMFSKASESNIEFEFTVTASVKYLVDSIIAVADLGTLLADLIENAIIATKISTKKNILVSINIIDCFYSIDIFDSGIPFEADTLLNLGQKKATTHANDGGSGIGMMTTFELLNKYHASLFIEEFPKDNCIFTKKVSIKFDNKNQYIVKTKESEKIQILEQRADLSLAII